VDASSTSHQQAFWDTNGLTISKGQYIPDDGNSYTPGLMSLALSSNTLVNTTGTVTLLSWSVTSGVTYRVSGTVECLQGSASVAQLVGLGGVSTAGPTRVFYTFIQDGTAQSISAISNSGTIGFITSPSYTAGRTFYFHFNAVVTPASSGTLALVASEGTSGDSFTVIAGSYVDVWQA
jgi:hypothetical protein